MIFDWKYWLVMCAMWVGWAVYQLVTGPNWLSLAFDVAMASAAAIMAVRAKKREVQS